MAHSAFGAGPKSQSHCNPSRPQVAGVSLCAKLQKVEIFYLFALTTATQRGVAIKAGSFCFCYCSWTRASVLTRLTAGLKVVADLSSTTAVILAGWLRGNLQSFESCGKKWTNFYENFEYKGVALKHIEKIQVYSAGSSISSGNTACKLIICLSTSRRRTIQSKLITAYITVFRQSL